MKSILSALVLSAALFLGGTLFAAGDGWLTNFETAKKEAAKRGVPILMDFTGSDWCGWCIKLDKEVFSKAAFKDYAKKNLVLFMADFPRKKKLPANEVAQNQKLQKTYEVRGYPTILLVDSKGKVIAKTGYRQGGEKVYVEHLKTLLKDFKPPKASGEENMPDDNNESEENGPVKTVEFLKKTTLSFTTEHMDLPKAIMFLNNVARDSDPEGKGVEFVLDLPAAEANELQISAEWEDASLAVVAKDISTKCNLTCKILEGKVVFSAKKTVPAGKKTTPSKPSTSEKKAEAAWK